MGVSLADMRAKLTITAGVTGAELIDRFGTKLNTVGKTADTVNKQVSSLNGAVRGLAAAFSVAGLASFTAEAARTTIQLDAFDKQLSTGFGQSHSIELEKLRDIMRGLGIAQDEALGSAVRFTSALKLSGQSAEQANSAFASASKLILSNKLSADGANRVYYAMAQIASKGKLMSEELNGQLGDVLSGFTQQVALSMGMSTAQLGKAMQLGKVSAEDFFKALNKIGDGIDPSQLESSARSLGDLKNAWFDFKAGLIDSSAIKATLDEATSGIKFLSANGSTLVQVFGIAATAAMGAFASKTIQTVVASAAATAANRAALAAAVEQAAAENEAALAKFNDTRVTLELARANAALGTSASAAAAEVVVAARAVAASGAAMAEATAAAEAAGVGVGLFGSAAGGLSALLGGPLGIALAAGMGAMYLYSSATNDAESRQLMLAQSAKALGLSLTDQSKAALAAKGETLGVGTGAAGAEPAIWSFKNATDGLTKSLWEQAKAARAASLELVNHQIAKMEQAKTEAKESTFSGSRQLSQQSWSSIGSGEIMKGLGEGWRSVKSDLKNLLTLGGSGHAAEGQVADADRQLTALRAKKQQLEATPISKDDLKGVTLPITTPVGVTPKRGRKQRTPEAIDKNYESMLNGITQEDINARQALINNTQARFAFERDALASEIAQKKASLAAAKDFSGTQRASVAAAIEKLRVDKLALINAQEADQLAREKNELARTGMEGEVANKQIQIDLTMNEKERNRLKREILDLEYQIERSKMEEVIAAKTSSDAEKALAQKKLDQLNQKHDLQVKQANKAAQGPLANYKDQLESDVGDMNKALQGVAVKGIGAVTDGLTDIVMGTKSVGDAFKEMAQTIIKELIRIAIQKAILSAISKFADGGAFVGGTQMYANGGAFSGGAQMFANGGAFQGGVQYFATGGVVASPTAFAMSGNKMGVMGEAGPEAIMPLRRMANGKLGVHATGAGGGTAIQQNNVTVHMNVDGGGTQVASSGEHAAALGKLITGVVQQEMIKQQRPGGLLSR